MHLTNDAIAVVTGGASGMGEAVVKQFIKAHAQVVILDRDVARGNQLASETNSLFIECDVADAQQVEAAFERVAKLEGVLRVAVNCAGIAPAKRAVGREGPMPLADFERVIQVNLVGTFNVIRLAAYHMSQAAPINEERGVIVNTASIAAYEGQIGQTAYSASKGGIVSMTLPLARELANLGIRVNTIAPGLVATPLLLNMPAEVQLALAASVPFPKRLGRPEEFASLVAHLIENALINGEVIRLDGALRMQPK